MSLKSQPLYTLCVFVVLVGVVHAQSWDRFRGPNGTGTCQATGLPSTLSPDQNVAWKIASGNGSSSPIISGDSLYFTSFDEATRYLHCVDAATGKSRWQRAVKQVRDETASRPNGPATCTPATDGTYVVAFYPDTALVCYSTAGDLLWRQEVGPFHSMHGIANSPILVNGLVIQLVDQLQESYIAAYDAATGKPMWKVDRIDGLTGGYSTPSLYQPQDGEPLAVASGARGLFAYRAATGDVAWSVPGVANAPVTVPVIWKSCAFLCEPVGTVEPISMLAPLDKNKDGKITLEEAKRSIPMYRFLERIDKTWGNDDGVIVESEWNKAFGSTVNKGGLVAVALAAPQHADQVTVKWTYRKSVPYVSSPVIYGDVLYIIADGGILTAVEPVSGKALKRARLKKGGGKFYASPVAADGKVFLLDTSGRVTVVRAGGTDWDELSTTTLGEPCFATPAIAGGRIYVRTAKSLFCFAKQTQ